MKLFFKSKDGGPKSNVTGYWLIECKTLFSIVLLRFSEGTRESYHNHAFNAVSWVLSGALYEKEINTEGKLGKWYLRSIKPIYIHLEIDYTKYTVWQSLHGLSPLEVYGTRLGKSTTTKQDIPP